MVRHTPRKLRLINRIRLGDDSVRIIRTTILACVKPKKILLKKIAETGPFIKHSRNKHPAQLYGHSRQGGHGFCQGILMGSESPTTTKQFNSPFSPNLFSIKNV